MDGPRRQDAARASHGPVPLWLLGLVHAGLVAATAPPLIVLWLALRWRAWDAEPALQVAFVAGIAAAGGLLFLGRALASALWSGWSARLGLAAVVVAAVAACAGAVPPASDPAPGKRIAVVGAGAAGLHAAWLLDRLGADVTVFEAAHTVGGHAHTERYVDDHGNAIDVDMGFIFGAPASYEEFKALLAWYGVPRVPVTLDLSAQVGDRRWATGGPGLDGEVARFQALADAQFDDPSLNLVPFGTWLDDNGFDTAFRQTYLEPLLLVLFITDGGLYEISARFVLNMMAGPRRWLSYEHGGVAWAVGGGSVAYYAPLAAELGPRLRLSTPVSAVDRTREGVVVTWQPWGGESRSETFDEVVLAVPANVARLLLTDRTWLEDFALGQVWYDSQEVLLHTDPRAVTHDEYVRSYNVRTWEGGLEIAAIASMQMGAGAVPLDPPAYVTLNPRMTYEGVLFRRTWKHYRMDLWHLAVNQALLPRLQGAGGVHYAGDWVNFIGHGQAVRTGLQAACRIAGTTPRAGLSTAPCVSATLVDALPSEGLDEETVPICGEAELVELLVDLACGSASGQERGQSPAEGT